MSEGPQHRRRVKTRRTVSICSPYRQSCRFVPGNGLGDEVPALKKRFGKSPFTGQDRWFAAKPASVEGRVWPLKELKEAAL